ncbi:hypothetical protein [Macrococcus equipercicus]|uniref:Uncharacterized protein n=1 Tax=Macrococcus equipercicus TaxID=69967 RepID=A0A9Q9BKJ2_9STAP|nr:hypothetical protein [Macrococcus equipercicus]UTH13293.1 hypothetical protein KFV11_08460 [Macrococcus equipercicus]
MLKTLDKNIALIAKYFNISPAEIMDGDFHFYMHQYNLSVEDEVETTKTKKTKRVESLFDAF